MDLELDKRRRNSAQPIQLAQDVDLLAGQVAQKQKRTTVDATGEITTRMEELSTKNPPQVNVDESSEEENKDTEDKANQE